MFEGFIYIALAVFGVTLGSFAGATVWRRRAAQLVYDKAHKQPYDKAEYKSLKKLTETTAMNDRSRCLHCDYTLRWYDLIPLVSWVTLKGRCRNCRTPIGWFEPLMELGMATYFVASYAFWPLALDSGLAVAHFILWLIAGVVMAIMFAYDTKWYLLPDRDSALLIAIGLLVTVVAGFEYGDIQGTFLSALGAVAGLAGLYLLLFWVSKGRWVGFGDVILGVGLGLLVIDWKLALLGLFLANLIGTLIAIPLMVTGRVRRGAHIPFGPLLISGVVLSWFFGQIILDWYLGLLGM